MCTMCWTLQQRINKTVSQSSYLQVGNSGALFIRLLTGEHAVEAKDYDLISMLSKELLLYLLHGSFNT